MEKYQIKEYLKNYLTNVVIFKSAEELENQLNYYEVINVTDTNVSVLETGTCDMQRIAEIILNHKLNPDEVFIEVYNKNEYDFITDAEIWILGKPLKEEMKKLIEELKNRRKSWN